MAWLLRQSSDWHATGVDVSPSLLQRARTLAQSLGAEQRLETYVARINQSNGEWRFGEEKILPKEPTSAPAQTTDISGSASSSSSSSLTPTVPLTGAAQRREKRKQKDLARSAAAAAAAAAISSPNAAFLNRQYDLIIMVRFLSRVFFRIHLNRLLRPGGFFLLSTFIDDGEYVFESPANPEFRIAGTGEVEKWAQEAGLEIVANSIGVCEDGRPISDCLLRKPIQAEEKIDQHSANSNNAENGRWTHSLVYQTEWAI